VSDPFSMSTAISEPIASAAAAGSTPEEERPPSCPSCNRRLVILATHWHRDHEGRSLRRQLWGCPRGHATAYRDGGAFTPVELMPDVAG
jgi:hypothetical protein